MGTIEKALTSSESISDFSYNAPLFQLTIVFRKGNPSIYTYHGVPPNIYAGLLSAPSKGQYFNANIRGVYTYERS